MGSASRHWRGTEISLTSDQVLGTSDLNRGLLGHLFNGYDETHVKTDLRRSVRTPRGKRVDAKPEASIA